MLGCHGYFAYLWVENADAYFQHLKSKGAELTSEISDQPWGMREFGVRTPDGHRLKIGHALAG